MEKHQTKWCSRVVPQPHDLLPAQAETSLAIRTGVPDSLQHRAGVAAMIAFLFV